MARPADAAHSATAFSAGAVVIFFAAVRSSLPNANEF